MTEKELLESIEKWIKEDHKKVAEAITYLFMSDGDKAEVRNIEKEYHRWLNN